MKRRFPEEENPDQIFALQQSEFLKWIPLLRRLGLKPRRFIKERDAFFFGTADGWYRLSLVSYPKEELKWLRNILEYLEERSFHNWAVPWQKTIIWEDNGNCYLIQPWVYGGELFQSADPAALTRVAEVLAEFHRSGRDYHEVKGMEIRRDRWRFTELSWENDLQQLDAITEEAYHEKVGKDMIGLKRKAGAAIREAIANWRSSGIHSLLEHQFRSGIISHGNLTQESIIWRNQDYYFLNWENLAFQPRIFDLATLIASVGIWESEWILFFIREYCRHQPFWTEEQAALLVLLKYPHEIMKILNTGAKDCERKNIKEVEKEVAKKERCLGKVWRELGSPQRWVWGKPAAGSDPGKLALSLSPVESWGDFTGQRDSLIQVNSEHKLPSDVLERLISHQEVERVYGSRDGNVLDAAAQKWEETEDFDEKPLCAPKEDLEIGGEAPCEDLPSPIPIPEVAPDIPEPPFAQIFTTVPSHVVPPASSGIFLNQRREPVEQNESRQPLTPDFNDGVQSQKQGTVAQPIFSQKIPSIVGDLFHQEMRQQVVPDYSVPVSDDTIPSRDDATPQPGPAVQSLQSGVNTGPTKQVPEKSQMNQPPVNSTLRWGSFPKASKKHS